LLATPAMIFPNLKNAFHAVIRLCKNLFQRKNPIADAKTVEKRLAICEKCPQLRASSRQCMACTCFVDLKANLTTETCPENRWP